MAITEYTLDVSKWRCGERSEHSLGKGSTQMLNKEGYMCCLGQFAKQVGVEDAKLIRRANPSSMYFAYDENFVTGDDWVMVNTDLAISLIRINDSELTTPYQKIDEITSKLAEHGIKLNVINRGYL